jgi:hypothetical protein
MKIHKFIGYFLVILLALFIVKAISFAFVMFFWVLKAMFIAAIIAGVVYLIDNLKNKN